MSFLGDAWDATGGKVVGAAKDIGNYITTGTTDPGKRRQQYVDPYAVDQNRFNLLNAAGAKPLQQNINNTLGDAQADATRAEAGLQSGFAAPAVTAPGRINTSSAFADTVNARTGIGAANALLNTAANDGRGRQVGAVNLVQQTALGQGPSVAPGMMRENAATAAANIERAASGANQQFGTASTGAQLAYADALAEQQMTAQQSGVNTARTIQQSAEDSIRQQAALTSAARGGNIAAALLNAQDNAAFQMAGANRQATGVLADQRLAAAAQAAAAQRQAASGQQLANLQTAQTLAAGQIGAREQQALGDARAAQLASQEQLAAQGLLIDATGQVRGQDLSGAQAATGIANVGLGADQLATNVAVSNADRYQQQAQFNANTALRADEINANLQGQNNALNADILSGQAQRAAQRESVALAAQGDFTALAAQMGMDAEQLKAQAYAAAQQAGLAWDQMGQDSRNKLIGGLFSAGGTIAGAAILSDKRAKSVSKKVNADDYSKAKPYAYEYKPAHRGTPGAGHGQYRGPMAQDLPKHLVAKGPDGLLRVDRERSVLSLMSAVGDLQRKIKTMEATR